MIPPCAIAALLWVAAGLGLCLRCMDSGVESRWNEMGPCAWQESEFCSCAMGRALEKAIPECDHGNYNRVGVLMNHGEPVWREKLERGRETARGSL